jgi:hypothetical protein
VSRFNRSLLKASVICASVLVASTLVAPIGSASAATHAITPSRVAAGALDPLSGKYPVGYLLCNYDNWHYKPNSLSYYKDLWVTDNDEKIFANKKLKPKFATYPDYVTDVSYGALNTDGSAVLGWYHMNVQELPWAYAGLDQEWLDCANSALAAGAHLTKFSAMVAVVPWVKVKVTGNGIAAWNSSTDWPHGHAHPNPETFTVASTREWPPTPFSMVLSSSDEYVTVTKVSGDKVTIIRGDGGTQEKRGTTFPAYPANDDVQSNTTQDQADVGPQQLYRSASGQKCTSGSGLCPSLSYSQTPGSTSVHYGVAALNGGDHDIDLAYTNAVGDTAHEVGHTSGYNHSRALTSSQREYFDCFDQMSYSCGLPDSPTTVGDPNNGGVANMDAINLEFHGWIPTSKQFNASNTKVSQATIKLRALSDPRALSESGDLDAHLPAKVSIEDADPLNTNPTVPATCQGSGYQCENSSYYTVEYRQDYGFDASLTGHDVPAGSGAIVLHLAVPKPKNCPGSCNISFLVDSQPGVSSGNGKPTLLPNDGALYAGDDYADTTHDTYVAVNSINPSSKSATVTVSDALINPVLAVTGALVGVAGTTATVQAKLSVGGAPVPKQTVTLALTTGQHCSATSDTAGYATCTLTLPAVGAETLLTASFAGDRAYHSKSASASYRVWSAPSAVPLPPSSGSTTEPAIAPADNGWIATWTDSRTHALYYSIYTGTAWSVPQELIFKGEPVIAALPPVVTTESDGLPVIAWTSSNNEIYYSQLNLLGWTFPARVAGTWGNASTGHSPAIAATPSSGLVVAWTGLNSHHLYFSQFTNHVWSDQVDYSKATTQFAPAVAASNSGSTDLEYFAWTNSNGSIGLLKSNNGALNLLSSIPKVGTDAAPALALTSDAATLFAAYKGKTSSKVYYDEYVDGTWAPQQSNASATTNLPVAIGLNTPNLILLWSAPTSGALEYSTTGF